MIIELGLISSALSVAISIFAFLLIRENNRLVERSKLFKELIVLARAQRDWINSGMVIQMVKQIPEDNFVFLDLEGVEEVKKFEEGEKDE